MIANLCPKDKYSVPARLRGRGGAMDMSLILAGTPTRLKDFFYCFACFSYCFANKGK